MKNRLEVGEAGLEAGIPDRRLSQLSRQEMMVTHQVGNSRGGEKWLDSEGRADRTS